MVVTLFIFILVLLLNLDGLTCGSFLLEFSLGEARVFDFSFLLVLD